MSIEPDYKDLLNKFMNYEQETHRQNQKKIKVGIKVNIILPLIFLILSFAISSGKLLFLIMWIISLFGIAFYLIYVEYSDYKMMERMKEYGMKINNEGESLLINEKDLQQAEERVQEKLDKVDEHRAKIKEAVREEIDEKIGEIKGGDDK
ncbi:MAG: hypothetical protein K6B67_03735 [Lachnospiraceae bacterium]|nr:hypothetical protein [Lachnospiraceae bacterium]